MIWAEVRQNFPHQWLLLEAIEAHTESDEYILDQISVVDIFEDGETAWQAYYSLHRQMPQREFFVLHTDREQPNIRVRRWLGIRPAR